MTQRAHPKRGRASPRRSQSGLWLDGAYDYVEIPGDDTLDVTGEFTIEA